MDYNSLPTKLRNFVDAFDDHVSGCIRDCECGCTYFDDYNSYDWAEGELESLQKRARNEKEKVYALGHSVSTLTFQGREYVSDCDCWHERANKIIGFLEGHAGRIVEYFTLEKKRRQEVADAFPDAGTVSDIEDLPNYPEKKLLAARRFNLD